MSISAFECSSEFHTSVAAGKARSPKLTSGRQTIGSPSPSGCRGWRPKSIP